MGIAASQKAHGGAIWPVAEDELGALGFAGFRRVGGTRTWLYGR